LYAALAPKSGRLIALLLPDMTGNSFEIFFNYFEQQVDKLHRGRKTLLILDQASAHQHRGAKKSKVVIKHLPVAAPELNCVERFFEELRKPFSNHIFKNINEVERFVCRVLKRWYQHPNLIIKLCLYPYMLYDKLK
jgi:DDE superfamily endonuclease